MLDIKRIKEDPAGVKAALRAKEVDCDEAVDKILALDEERRRLIADTEARKARQNKVSKEIPALKKQGKDVAPILKEMAELKAGLAEDAAKLDQVLAEYRTWMLSLPNLPDPDLVPGGKENNQPLLYFGEPHKFDFPPKHHVDLCLDLGLIDYERGTKLAGSGFWMYTGLGARLEWALLNYFIDTHVPTGTSLSCRPICWSTSAARRRASSPNSPTRSTRSPTPPATGFTICSPPPRRPWPACTGTKF